MRDHTAKQEQKIKSIGGRVETAYYNLMRALRDTDSNYLEPLQRLGKAKTLDQYLEAVFSPPGSTEEEFISRWIEKYGAKYNTTRKARDAARSRFLEIIGTRNRGFEWQRPLDYRDFYKALSLDPEEGLCLNLDIYLQIWEERTRAERTELGKLHTEIVEKLNLFFNVPVTEELLKRYFRIEKYRIVKNPNGSTLEGYMALGTGKG